MALVVLAVFGSCSGTVFRSPTLTLQLSSKQLGSFSLSVNGQPWLKSLPPQVHANASFLQLLPDKIERNANGTASINYRVPGTSDVVLTTSFTSVSNNLVIFEQCIKKDLSHTALVPSDPNTGKDGIVTSFPAFAPHDNTEFSSPPSLGFFAYNDQMVGGMENGTRYGRWGVDPLPSGTMVGPVVLFAPQGAGALVLAPFSNFMAQNVFYDSKSRGLSFGLLGSATSVPAGTCTSVAAYLDTTPTTAVLGYGATLRDHYGKTQLVPWQRPADHPLYDATTEKLGYSTDNGAFYYYNSFPFRDPQDALENVFLKSNGSVPLSSLLLDSWWYFKGPHGGLANWTARPDVFPEGLPAFQRRIGGVPIVAHSRYWSPKVAYATANGGTYDFIIEAHNQRAMPTEQRFWDDLLGNASREWGMSVYEQDWLHNEWENMDATLQNLTRGRTWLLQMGRAAAKHRVRIQYCMAYPRFALASVQVPAVDQVRVSDDYRVDLTHTRSYSVNLYVGTSSLLASALGLSPSKDVFWSTSRQPGSKYGPSTREQHPELEAVVSLLSAGPVAVGDRFGFTNWTLLRSITTQDGTLLKPSWPAVPLNAYHTYRALGSHGPQGEVTRTYTRLGSGVWSSVLAIDLKQAYDMDIRGELPEYSDADPQSLFFVYPGVLRPTTTVTAVQSNLTLAACQKADYGLYHLTAAAKSPKLTLLGEVGKVLPVSAKRFITISTDTGLKATVRGSPGENITAISAQTSAAAAGHPLGVSLFVASCVVPSSGTQCELTFSTTNEL